MGKGSEGPPRLLRMVIAGAVALAAAAGCSTPGAQPADPPPVVVPATVSASKVPAPAVVGPAGPPAVDTSALVQISPLTVVPGLPGVGDATPRHVDGASSGPWQTVTLARDTVAFDGYRDPHPVGLIPQTTLKQVPTVLPVLDDRGNGWLRVMVATRGALPSQDRNQVNGRTAWINAADTSPSSTAWSVHVDTTAQTITVDDGTGPHVYPVRATGAPATPTPPGLSFVVGTFWDEPGTYTPRVILLSTQSEAIDHWDRPTGTAVTAIHTSLLHGTGAVSNGCVRVSDEVLDVLWHRVPAGTVVTVT
ncbi:L,D-transpeptidase [Cellulomonas sp. URHD0024]|uniref:L,D-transpeptidase n=1 Tax=Cellulomonas sp. URHD0024 TaxID=1302620 RepID=UPI001E51D7A0|nr:L,D-transpeptidase [Cellulomonas sp. URHD0024]